MSQTDHTDEARGPESDARREGQAPLLLQDMQLTEEALNLPARSSHARPAVVTGLIVAAAVGALLAMRHFGLGPALSLADVSVQYERAETQPGASPAKVLADLERSRRAVQVPADYISSDPFELAVEADTPKTPAIDADLARQAELERQRLAREARLRELETAADKLTLQSVILGAKPIARINDRMYQLGSTVEELFTVEAIEGRQVTLAADGLEFTITLDTERNTARPRNRRR